jgi:acyl-CoA reductase-like NAD-dependent aldehyde dehydrogenase
VNTFSLSIRILASINEAEAAGAKILLDGRAWATERPAGYWVGPTIILHSSVDDRSMKDEILGPVLSVYCASSWDEAVAIENNSAYGLASSVYSDRGSNAEWFAQRFRAGMQGINECFPPSRGILPHTLHHFYVSVYSDTDRFPSQWRL